MYSCAKKSSRDYRDVAYRKRDKFSLYKKTRFRMADCGERSVQVESTSAKTESIVYNARDQHGMNYLFALLEITSSIEDYRL